MACCSWETMKCSASYPLANSGCNKPILQSYKMMGTKQETSFPTGKTFSLRQISCIRIPDSLRKIAQKEGLRSQPP